MIDIIAALIFIIFIWRGYKKGFLKSAYQAGAFLISIILAYMLYPYVRSLIMASPVGNSIRSFIQTKYVMPSISGNTATDAALPGYLRSMIANGQAELADALTGFLTNLAVNAVSFISVFIAVRIIIAAAGKILDITSRLPVIRFFDRGLGVITGLFESVLVIYLVLTIVYAFAPLRENTEIQNYIGESVLVKEMYENNPIVRLILPTDYENIAFGGIKWIQQI